MEHRADRSVRPTAIVATASPVAGELGRVDVAVDLERAGTVGDLGAQEVTSPDGELVASGEVEPDAEAEPS